MSADDCLLFVSGLCSIDPIEPSCLRPMGFISLSPRSNIAVALIPVRNARDPCMSKNIVLRFKVIEHCRDNLFVEWRILCCVSKIIISDRCHHRIKSSQLKRCIVGTIRLVMTAWKPPINGHKLYEQVFMVASNEYHSVLLHLLQHKLLNLLRFVPPIKYVTEHDQLVWSIIRKEACLFQGRLHLRIIYVYIRNNIVPHRFLFSAIVFFG